MGDALYLDEHFLQLCDELKFKYIIRYKDTDSPQIKKDFDKIKKIDDSYQYQNGIIFGDLKNKGFYHLNVISYNE